MKIFIKVFTIAFVCFMLAIGAGMWAFNEFYTPEESVAIHEENTNSIDIVDSKEEKEVLDPKSAWEKVLQESKRTNVLLLGMEGPRTDTIVLASFDPDTKDLDLISVPRDTYYERSQYRAADKQKINAVYGDDGVDGIMKAVSDTLGEIPIEYYVKVTYNGVERIVDSLGGVKVNVPMNMNYDDPYAKPPLHIHLRKGSQTLDGKHAIQFLRFRKGYPNGDIGRIQAQQQFMKAAMNKALGFRLPIVANTVMNYVKTNVPLSKIAVLAKDAIGMKGENLSAHAVPGKPTMRNHLSYFLTDGEETKKMIQKMYGYEEGTE